MKDYIFTSESVTEGLSLIHILWNSAIRYMGLQCKKMVLVKC